VIHPKLVCNYKALTAVYLLTAKECSS